MTRCTYPGCGGRLMAEPAYEQVGTVGLVEPACMLCGRPPGCTPEVIAAAVSCSRPGCLDRASERSSIGECSKHLIVRRRTEVTA
jgi:hypothetical protein